MSLSIETPNNWTKSTESNVELTTPGESFVFTATNGYRCIVTVVEETSTATDLYAEIVDSNGEQLESLWLSERDYPNFEIVKEEIFDQVSHWLQKY